MSGHPAGGKGPESVHGRTGSVDTHGIGEAPDVGVVVGDKAPSTVVSQSGVGAGDPQGVMEEAEQRLMELRQGGGFHGPVVHFRVDVDGEVGAPRSAEMLVPDALEVGGLGSGTGAGDDQIPSVLIEQSIALGIHVLVPTSQALDGGGVVLVRAEVHGDSVEVGLIVCHMAGHQILEVVSECLLHILLAQFHVGLTVQIGLTEGAVKAGLSSDQQGDAVSTGNLEVVLPGIDLTALGLEVQHCAEAHTLFLGVLFIDNGLGGVALVGGVHLRGGHAIQDQAAVFDGSARTQTAVEAGLQADGTGFVCGDPQDDHLIGSRDKSLAGIGDIADGVGQPGDSVLQAEAAAIVGHFALGMIHFHPQVGQRQIALGIVAEDFLLDQGLSLGVFLLPYQLAGLTIVFVSTGDISALGIAGPQGILVEGEGFLLDTGPDHSAQTSVAQGEGFLPVAGRFLIPKLKHV